MLNGSYLKVSLGIDGASIPIATIVGLIAGAIVGYFIYRTGSTFALHWFLVVSTCFLFLIGAGLMSKAVWFLQYYVSSLRRKVSWLTS